MILCAFGGTHAESWIREEVMRKDTIYNKVYRNYTPDKMAPTTIAVDRKRQMQALEHRRNCCHKPRMLMHAGN